MYSAVQFLYLGLAFILILTFQLYTFWGSRLLCLVLGINLLIPVIAISLMSGDQMKKQMGNPSDTDKFMMKKGGNATLADAKNSKEFWLIFLSFSIIIGIARMMDDNASLIALQNSSSSQTYQRAFQVFEVLGCFTTGAFLSLFRLYVSPYAAFAFLSFLLLASQILMFFVALSSFAQYVAVIIVGFVSGGAFCLIGIISHEDYGTKWVSKIIGYFMTGAAFGILIFDEIIFDVLYNMFASESNVQN